MKIEQGRIDGFLLREKIHISKDKFWGLSYA